MGGLMVLLSEARALTAEEGLNEIHGQEAIALRTFTKSPVPTEWRRDTPDDPYKIGPYFEDTNHHWRTAPRIHTAQNVLNVLDHCYLGSKGQDPFPIQQR